MTVVKATHNGLACVFGLAFKHGVLDRSMERLISYVYMGSHWIGRIYSVLQTLFGHSSCHLIVRTILQERGVSISDLASGDVDVYYAIDLIHDDCLGVELRTTPRRSST